MLLPEIELSDTLYQVISEMDVKSKFQRSENMSRIHGKDTKPEMIVRSFLHRHGFRFRLHSKVLPGHPDIVLPKYRTIIEVRGCFWHRHPGCKFTTTPASNLEFWQKKFHENVRRDEAQSVELRKLGWDLLVIWGCETSRKNFPPPSLLDFVRKAKEITQ